MLKRRKIKSDVAKRRRKRFKLEKSKSVKFVKMTIFYSF